MKPSQQYKWRVTYTANPTRQIIASYVKLDGGTATFWNEFIEQEPNGARKYTNEMISVVPLRYVCAIDKGETYNEMDEDIHY